MLTLSTTTLLHEAYLDIRRREAAAFPDRNRFLGYAARAMRGLVISYARNRHVQRRGGEMTFVSLDESRALAAIGYPARSHSARRETIVESR